MKNPKDQIIFMSPRRPYWERKYIPKKIPLLPIKTQIKEWEESDDGYVDFFRKLDYDNANLEDFSYLVSDVVSQILEERRFDKKILDKKVIDGVPGITRYMLNGKDNAVFRRDGYGDNK